MALNACACVSEGVIDFERERIWNEMRVECKRNELKRVDLK